MRRNDSINRGGRFFSALSHSRMAVLIERLLGILIPVVGLVYPLPRFVPAVYNRSMRSKAFRLDGPVRPDRLIDGPRRWARRIAPGAERYWFSIAIAAENPALELVKMRYCAIREDVAAPLSAIS
jgi:hypothetical protein